MVEDTAHLKAFHMPFDSMEPTIATGAKVIGDVGYYGSNRPQRWEVVVFSLPGNDGEFIKRIVGLPGEKITLGPAGLLVDGSPVERLTIRTVFFLVRFVAPVAIAIVLLHGLGVI